MSRSTDIRGLRSTRRAWLAGLAAASGGAAVSLPFWSALRAEPLVATPTRLLIVHFPCGTVSERWFPTPVADFTLGEISAPFEPLRDKMVFLQGLDIIREDGAPGDNHGSGMVTVASGGSPISAPAFDTPVPKHASIDQLLAEQAEPFAGTPMASLQLAADTRADRDDLYHRVFSYGSPQGDNPWAQPLPPLDDAQIAFSHLFGGIVAGDEPDAIEALEKLRQRRLSVSEFLDRDLERLSARVPSSQLAKMQAHKSAIEELQASLQTSVSQACIDTTFALQGTVPGEGASHQAIGMSHLQMIKTAFLCDITRVGTFMWASGTSHVNFSDVIPGVRDQGHHGITHSSSPTDELALIDHWYAERMAEFLLDLDATPDPFAEGSLLDNTLVVYLSEMAKGGHTFQDVPAVLFGGTSMGLTGGRYLQYDHRSYNDLWLAVAQAFGLAIDVFGDEDKSGAPLENLFA